MNDTFGHYERHFWTLKTNSLFDCRLYFRYSLKKKNEGGFKMYDVVRYNNGLNTVPLRKFTPVEMDIFWAVCSKMKRKGTEELTFDFDDFQELAKYDRREKDSFYTALKNTWEKMKQLDYSYEDDGYYEDFVLFQRFAIDKDNEKVIIQASERFEFVLNAIGTNFTRFELENLTGLDSSYSKELYRQLMQYRSIETKSGYWAVTVDDFRELLDIPDSYRMSHIDSRVFNTAKKELLNSKDGRPPIFDSLSIEKIKAKKGNKIQRFVIRFKEYEDPNPVPMINFMTGEEI